MMMVDAATLYAICMGATDAYRTELRALARRAAIDLHSRLAPSDITLLELNTGGGYSLSPYGQIVYSLWEGALRSSFACGLAFQFNLTMPELATLAAMEPPNADT